MLQRFKSHMLDQKLERLVYADTRLLARPTGGSPFGSVLSLIGDGAGGQGTYTPRTGSESVKGFSAGKLEFKSSGFYVHHVGFYFLNATSGVTHGVNLTVECLVYVYRDLQLRYGADALPTEANWQGDNCTADNKATTLFAFAQWLVRLGIHDKITIRFLLRGHTHEDASSSMPGSGGCAPSVTL